MSSSSLVTGALPLGSIGSPQPGHRTTGKVSSASLPMLRSPESRQYELIARLWRFPADVRKAAAVTFLQPVNRKTASWTAAIKIPDHRTVSPQSLVRVPRSGSGRADGRIREAAHAAERSVGRSAEISGDAAASRASRQRADRRGPEGHELTMPHRAEARYVAADRDVIRRVGKNHLRPLVAEKPLITHQVASVSAENSVSAQNPDVTRPSHWIRVLVRNRNFILLFGTVPIQQPVDLAHFEPAELKINVPPSSMMSENSSASASMPQLESSPSRLRARRRLLSSASPRPERVTAGTCFRPSFPAARTRPQPATTRSISSMTVGTTKPNCSILAFSFRIWPGGCLRVSLPSGRSRSTSINLG